MSRYMRNTMCKINFRSSSWRWMIAGSQKLVSGTMGAIGSGPNYHWLSICLSNPQCSVKDNFAEFWLNLVKIVHLSLSLLMSLHIPVGLLFCQHMWSILMFCRSQLKKSIWSQQTVSENGPVLDSNIAFNKTQVSGRVREMRLKWKMATTEEQSSLFCEISRGWGQSRTREVSDSDGASASRI